MTPWYNIGGSNRRDKAFFRAPNWLLAAASDDGLSFHLGEYRRFLNGNTARKRTQNRPFVPILGSWSGKDQGHCTLIRTVESEATARPATSFCRPSEEEYLVFYWLILFTVHTVPDGKSCNEGVWRFMMKARNKESAHGIET